MLVKTASEGPQDTASRLSVKPTSDGGWWMLLGPNVTTQIRSEGVKTKSAITISWNRRLIGNNEPHSEISFLQTWTYLETSRDTSLLRIGRNQHGSDIPRDALLEGSAAVAQMDQHRAAWAPHRARVAERISAAAAAHTQHAAADPRQPHQVPFPPFPFLLSPGLTSLIQSKVGVLHVLRK